MKVILQRVSRASVSVDKKIVGEIAQGYLLLTGFGQGDNEQTLLPMAKKIIEMRLFPDDRGRFHHSLSEVSGEILVVPQFTLFADTSKGRRPEFFGALDPKEAIQLYEKFLSIFRSLGVKRVEGGSFGEHMEVSLVNDGPVTIPLEI